VKLSVKLQIFGGGSVLQKLYFFRENVVSVNYNLCLHGTVCNGQNDL